MRMDAVKHGVKCQGMFDAVVCDPPYGHRAALCSGVKNGDTETDGLQKRKPVTTEDGEKRELCEAEGEIEESDGNYQGPTKKNESVVFELLKKNGIVEQLTIEPTIQALYEISSRLLKKGGRLVYLHPGSKSESWNLESELQHYQSFKFISKSENKLSKDMSRFLVTMIKL